MQKNIVWLTLSLFSFLIFAEASERSPKTPTQILKSMTLREKIGQLFMVHFRGETINEDAIALIQDIGVGGIIYYNWANGLNSSEQTRLLSLDLQTHALKRRIPIPLFIAVDQEGGRVSRLKNGFTTSPGNRALGLANDPDLTEKTAFIMGKELKEVGINMNLAPVIDINSNPQNPIIGDRSFGASPTLVYVHGDKALSGYKRANIIATLKHYPGHGDVEKDSHLDLPILNKTLEEIQRFELFPFEKLAAKADAIMTAHLLVPAFDPESCSTLSKKTIDYLRKTIGFNGIIITDSLIMEGVLKQAHTVEEAAIQAFNAGCDILLLGGRDLLREGVLKEISVCDIERIYNSMLEAIYDGRISEQRLNESVQRILELKLTLLTQVASRSSVE